MLVAADSSAIVKLVLAEEGSDLARLVWQEADRVVATRLARVESAAAVAAARRDRRIRRAGEARAHAELESLWLGVDVRELTQGVEREAVELARAHPISGADALHVATAIELGAVLLTWDQRQAAAATAEGIAVIPQG
jgi:uncharacterized protein